MPGGPTSPLNNPFVVSLFHHALGVQFVIIFGLALVLVGVFVLWRNPAHAEVLYEARSRTWLRWSFGALWLVDAWLQRQPSMPLGLGDQIVRPSADGTPWWLHEIVLNAVGVWNRHPIALASASVWIEAGIGLALLCSRGWASRVAAVVSIGWGLVIWSVSNAMGGIFSTGASLLFGWPGAVAFYVVAGVFLAGPSRWFPESFAKVTLRLMSLTFAGGIVFQVWPSHGFWHGGANNALAAMASDMSNAAQPTWIAWLVKETGHAASSLGGGMNMIAIFWMAACSVGLWRLASRDERWGLWTFYVGAALCWVLVQDTALFGGLSTDVNSMVPMALLVFCASPRRRSAAPLHLGLRAAPRMAVAATIGAIATAMIVVAVVPMLRSPFAAAETTAFYTVNPGFSIVHAVAAPRISGVDQHHHVVSFPETSGRYTLVSFLDPHCWTDCPLLAAQLATVLDTLPASEAAQVQVLAVAADPYHESVSDLNEFLKKYGIAHLNHFTFVTSSLQSLQKIWRDYGIDVSMRPTDKMSVHTDVVYVVNPAGQIRVIVGDDPVASPAGTASSAQVLIQALTSAGLR